MMCRRRLHQLLAIFNIILPFALAMNKPVYKIILNSMGYAQFVQYDMDMPPLTEFTLCVWVRVTSVDRHQSLFTYIGDYDNRIMHVRLDAGGQQMSIFLRHDRVMSRAAVDFKEGVWRDVCLSYQSDYGAWALYIDAQLVLCEASKMVKGFEIPGQGRLIFGYGRSDEGSLTGLSGEIYGVSMIPFSTIERNNTFTKEPWSKQNAFRNQIKNKHKLENEYIILGDLKTDEIHTGTPVTIDKQVGDPFLHTLPRSQENKVSRLPIRIDKSHDKLLNDFKGKQYRRFIDKNKNKFINDIYRVQHQFNKELSESDTQDLPIVLEYETPPSVTASTIDYYEKQKNPMNLPQSQDKEMIISDVEKPPPPVHDSKVYGQWINSRFASNVLSYLKNNNYNTNKKKKQVPPTIPEVKLSDSYPYPSASTYEAVRPSRKYKKMIYIEPRHKIEKRDFSGQQINVKIIDTEVSQNAKHYPKYPELKHVEITNRGETKKQVRNKSHKSMENFESLELGNTFEPTTFEKNLENSPETYGRHRGNHLMEILPYLQPKGVHYDPTIDTETNQVYSKSFSSANKWHNVKWYNNDNSLKDATYLDSLLSVNPSVNIDSKKMPKHSKTNPYEQERELINSVESIINGRKLAKEVSKQSSHNYFKVPLLKYRSTQDDPGVKTRNKIAVREIHNEGITRYKNNFDKHVKLGNALNEQLIMGFNNHEIKNSFLGGDDTVPDINKYRSEWNSQSKIADVPSSLGARLCKNAELYIQEDQSITSTKILYFLVRKNIGIEFITQSYKKCSSGDIDSKIVIIDWVKTPVILFGGAYPEKTKDLCGFF